ncbi:phosphoribosylformylglycinamidine synthase subunit PurS [PVC group bacterium (ex Bugula neritina AB1)]|nr:phosphoribosylformylglycinamidine synthase subunit PurS [PVC group bacterium (ex Bugula neritina AB1)]
MYRAQIYISLKSSIADPQGISIEKALHSLDYKGIKDVRVGKYLELNIDQDCSEDEARACVVSMCEKLLVNEVIERYHFDLEKEE